MKVTMSDVAKKLGISQSTVSLALSNSPKLPKTTVEQVQEVATEMGYIRNPYVSALMASRRHGKAPDTQSTIALIAAGESAGTWKTSLHQSQFIESCNASASSLGVKTELFWIAEEQMTAKRMNDILYNRAIRGAILLPAGPWPERLDYAWSDIATVSYGVYQISPATDRISSDYYGNMELTRTILREQGFKRLGFAMDRAYHYPSDNRWLASYLMTHFKDQMDLIDPWLDPAPSFDGFKTWLKQGSPDAIICVHAPTVIDWLKKLGLRVPEDISVVAIGTAEEGGEVSGIVENTGMCGRLALEMLLHRIHRNEFGPLSDPQNITVSGHWNRGSTARHV